MNSEFIGKGGPPYAVGLNRREAQCGMEEGAVVIGKVEEEEMGFANSEESACENMEMDDTRQEESLMPPASEGSNTVFSWEAVTLQTKDTKLPSSYNSSMKKACSRGISGTLVLENDVHRKREEGHGGRLSRQDRIKLGRVFQGAVSSQDWELADTLISLADAQTLNDALCISLDAIWFLTTQPERNGITRLIKKIVGCGANDFNRVILRTSFLASCISACQSRTMSLSDTLHIMAQRLHERLQEHNGDERLKVEVGAKVQKFTEWTLKCISVHSRSPGKGVKGVCTTNFEIQLQLSAFKYFLDLVGNNLTGKDFTEAFDAACFPLTLFSNSFDPGWTSGTSAAAVQGLLGMLVEGGADSVNQCFLEASRFGSTELVSILLQVAQRNSLDVDVDLALGFAAHYGKIRTMECLVDEGNATAFTGPLMHAAERGCMQVVQWFVKRGCRDTELCLALTAATSTGQIDIAAYLLPHVPQHALSTHGFEILKAAGERNSRSLDGISFLLSANFLGDAAATYAVADSVARCEDEGIAPELKAFLREHWSEEAFVEGLSYGKNHYVNFARVFMRAGSPIRLRDLPASLVSAIAYLPLYRECAGSCGSILSQRLRGQLVEAAGRSCGQFVDRGSQSKELLAALERFLMPFLINTPPSL